MKILTNFLKYFSLILLTFFLLKLTKHYGDYKQTVYDVLLIFLAIILILINIFVLYKIQKKTRYYKILKIIIIVGFLGVLLNIIFNSLTKNRETLSVYRINHKADLTLYKNQTFTITEYSPHIFQHWSGNYKIIKNTLLLSDINFEKMSHLQLSNKYIIDKRSENYIGNEDVLVKKKRKHYR